MIVVVRFDSLEGAVYPVISTMPGRFVCGLQVEFHACRWTTGLLRMMGQRQPPAASSKVHEAAVGV